MSKDDHTKETVPPPEEDDDDFLEQAEERTVLANVPEELIAESLRAEEEAVQRPSAPEGGLRQMFARDAGAVRDALPTEAEGDALLDMLFEDATVVREEISVPPAPPPEPPGAEPPRPAVPPRPEPPRPVPPPRPPLRRTSSPELSPEASALDEETPDSSPGVGVRMASATEALLAALDDEPTRMREEPAAVPPPMAPPASPPAAAVAVEDEPTHVRGDVPGLAPPPLDAVPDAAVVAAGPGDAGDTYVEPAHEAGAPEAVLEALDEDEEPPRLVPMPSRPPAASAFSDEREASFALAESGQQALFAARAAWLRDEAAAMTDDAAKARTLLVVSELYAMVGEDVEAADVALEAHRLATSAPVISRQNRGHMLRSGDWTAVLTALDAETRAAPTPVARCHGAWFGAEIARLRLGDSTASQKRSELSLRGMATDPRGYVQRCVEALRGGAAEAAALPKLRPPENAQQPELTDAITRLGIVRGVLKDEPRGPFEAVLVAKACLDRGDARGAVAALESVKGGVLADGLAWLVASLGAARADTREQAASALRSLLEGADQAQARRALAALAIEMGNADAARAAMEAPDAFGPGDRVALGALTGATREEMDPVLQSAAHDGELGALTAATSAAVGQPDDPERRVFAVGADRSRVATGLARILAGVDPATVDLSQEDAVLVAVSQLVQVAPDSGVAKALTLELDIESKNIGKVAETLATWGGDTADGGRDRALAAALIAEVAKDGDRAVEAFDQARAADRTHEGAARARAAHADVADAARILAEHAEGLDHVTDAERAAVLLTESGARLAHAGASDEADAAFRRASELAPTLPFALHLGERLARTRGDRDALIEWLRARRESSDDPIEQAFDLVREALLLSDGEGVPASVLLERALAARPGDVGLRDLFERLSPEPPSDRAAWRAQRLSEAEGPERARLAVEAALEFERIGDLATAAECIREAVAAGDTLFAPLVAYRYALAGHGTAELVDAMLPRARETEDPEERIDIYRRLADLDELGRNDVASGLLWHRTILEERPRDLPTLRRVANSLLESGREDEFEPIALQLTKILEGPEAVAHAAVAVRLRRRTSWEEAGEAVSAAYRLEPRGVWVLRQMSAYARAEERHALACEADRQLMDRTGRSSEIATLALRAAESAMAAKDIDLARELLSQAAALAGDHLVVQLQLADVLEATGDHSAAATQLEAAAEAAFTPAERARAYARAAKLWRSQVGDLARARRAYEQVIDLDPSRAEAFEQLQAIYVESGARAELADLLKRRLDNVTDPTERVEMEVMRGRALADVGDPDAAKRALAAALEANPDHVDALSAFAELCMADEDYSGGEQALIRLARLASEPEKQAEIYMRLGDLYDDKVPNPERAELAYQEILKRSPQNEAARERLVALYKKAGDVERAMEQQNVLVNAANTPEAKCQRTVELAAIFEVAGDAKKAEQTLVAARKQYPKSHFALMALVRYYQRSDQAQAATVLLDRAAADARRALGTGRFEEFLFETLATVAELKGRGDAAAIANATVSALRGVNVDLAGAGRRAGEQSLDDLIAPDLMSPAFRELLTRTGPLLDTALPYDLGGVRATPLPAGELADVIGGIAMGYGLGPVQVHVSSVLGTVCVAASANPPVLVIGESLVASDEADVRAFLVHRALKVMQANAAVFARTAPIDLWPVLAAFLKAFNQSWNPQGVDAGRLTDAYGRISRSVSANIDPQVPLLAAEVIGSIGNRASTLNTVVNGWGDRAGLLAFGDPCVALRGIALAGGHTDAPPPSGKERLTWVGRNAEARELIVFSVSEAYADARARLGI